jgi:hypothetical protein
MGIPTLIVARPVMSFFGGRILITDPIAQAGENCFVKGSG